jgi:hypothetical protein
LNLETFFFDIEISGYGYSEDNRAFNAKMQGLKSGSNDLVYQSSFSVQGTMPGGIKSCIYQGKPGFILGDGTISWSIYDILEIKRLSTRSNASNNPNFHDGWSSAVVSNLSAVTLSQTGQVGDQSPYSTTGVSRGSSKVKSYRNLVCDLTDDGGGYVILKMTGSSLGNFVNGTITIADYVTQNLETVATINFNLLGNTGELARYARIEGTFGSDEVSFYVDPNGDNYIVLGDGSDSWSTSGQVCLDRLTVNGNQAGEYGSKVSYQIYTTNDVFGLELVPVTVVRNSGDQTLSVSGDQVTLSRGGGSVTIPTDGNGIYSTSATIPVGRVASAASHTGGTVGRTKLHFAEAGASSSRHTGFQSFAQASDTGVKLNHRLNNVGATLSSSLELSNLVDKSTFSNDTWYYNNSANTVLRGFRFVGNKPAIRVGSASFIDMPAALPAHNNSAWIVDANGSGGKYKPVSYRAAKDRAVTLTNTSFATDAELQLNVPVGNYDVRCKLIFQGENTNSELMYRVASATTIGNVNAYTSKGESVLTQAFTGNTFGELYRTENAAGVHMIIIEGTLQVFGASTLVAVQRGVLDADDSVTLEQGSFIELTLNTIGL